MDQTRSYSMSSTQRTVQIIHLAVKSRDDMCHSCNKRKWWQCTAKIMVFAFATILTQSKSTIYCHTTVRNYIYTDIVQHCWRSCILKYAADSNVCAAIASTLLCVCVYLSRSFPDNAYSCIYTDTTHICVSVYISYCWLTTARDCIHIDWSPLSRYIAGIISPCCYILGELSFG